MLTNQRPNLKHVRVFGCCAYVLQLPRPSKFEPRPNRGLPVYTLPHGVYKLLLQDENGTYHFVESRHVTFPETRFLGAGGLPSSLDEESSSDDEFTSESEIRSDEISNHLEEVSFEDEGSESSVNDSNKNDDDSDISNDNGIDLDDNEEHDPEELPLQITGTLVFSDVGPLYSRQNRRKPPQWYVASSAHSKETITVTTSDNPTVKEAVSATAEERDLWEIVIDDESNALHTKETWEVDDFAKSQPLPAHVILKFKRNSGGSIERFKARVVAGENCQVYGWSELRGNLRPRGIIYYSSNVFYALHYTFTCNEHSWM